MNSAAMLGDRELLTSWLQTWLRSVRALALVQGEFSVGALLEHFRASVDVVHGVDEARLYRFLFSRTGREAVAAAGFRVVIVYSWSGKRFRLLNLVSIAQENEEALELIRRRALLASIAEEPGPPDVGVAGGAGVKREMFNRLYGEYLRKSAL